jgi:5-methylcytosine-specific restriction enzyme subunit McrC
MTEDKGILIRNIYYMLAYAFQELRQNNYAEIEGEKFDDIYDLFAEIIARGVSYQLKQGLYREYVAKNESMQTIKGKIDINGTIANRVRNNRQISCDYDELSENNVYNQILLTTVTILIRHSDVKKAQKDKLKKLMLFFQNVQPIDLHTIRWTALRFDRNNRNYRMLTYLCYFIMSEWLMTTEEGKMKMREFSDDHMCRLFEKFVLEYYKKHHPELKPCAAQIDWNVEKEQSSMNILPIMQTDILLTMEERTLIIDTKYYTQSMQKQYDKVTIHSNNLYQINTYVTEYDKEHKGNVDGMLLYAKTQEEIVPDDSIKKKDGNIIYFKTLDLNIDFDSIKKRLDSFVCSYKGDI